MTTKAREKLGWCHRTTFAELVREMMESDLEAVKQEQYRISARTEPK